MKKSLDNYLLLIFVIAAGLLAFLYALMFFNAIPPFLGPIDFFASGWLGGLVWAGVGLAYVWLVVALVKANPKGLGYATVLAVVSLGIVLVTFIGGTAFRVLLPACGLNGLVLLYATLPGTKKVFKG